MRNYNELITDLNDWEAHNECEIGPDVWLAGMGSFNLAVAFTSLFWPEFVIHDDSVLIAPLTEQRLKNFLSFQNLPDNDITRTEVTMNHQHIMDFFPNDQNSPTREQVLYLGRILKDMWQLKLNRDFPDRVMIVSFPEEFSENLMDYEISFWQERVAIPNQ